VGVVVLVLVGAGIVALASGGDDDGGQATGGKGTGSTATTGGQTTETTRRDTPATTAGRPGGPCKAADMTTRVSGSTIRGSSQVVIVALDNTGGRQCTVTGAPSLAFFGLDGRALTVTATEGGGAIRPELTAKEVSIEPGGQASFMMSWSPIGSGCLDVRSFQVTLPGDSKASKVDSSVTVCNRTVNYSPIQAGVITP